MEQFLGSKVLFIVIFVILAEWGVAYSGASKDAESTSYRQMDVTITWPESEVGVISGRGKRFTLLPSDDDPPPCAHTPIWASAGQFGVISTGSSPNDQYIKTNERVYTVTCPPEEGASTRKHGNYYIPREFLLEEMTLKRHNKVVHQFGSATVKVDTDGMTGMASVLNVLIPKILTNNDEQMRFDTKWEVTIKEIFHMTKVLGVKPTKTVLDAYNRLPSQYDGNEIIYNGYFTKVGTDSVSKYGIGGSASEKFCLDGKGKLVSKSDGNSNDTSNKSFVWDTLYLGGTDSRDLAAWEATLIEAPRPLWYITDVLTDLLDPYKNDPIKVESFLKGRQVEQEYYEFKRHADEIISILPISDNKLHLFIKDLLAKQLTFIKPHSGIMKSLQTELATNPSFNRFRLLCLTHGVARDIRINVIPGPCYSFPRQICRTVTSNVEDSGLRFLHFSGPNCSGTPAKTQSAKKYRMDGELFKQFRSIRLAA